MMDYEAFVRSTGPRLRAALVAAYGPQVGAEATADALAYGFEHWTRVGPMANPAGYLYRVGQTAARRSLRPSRFLPTPPATELPEVEPALVPALESLSEAQRVCVVMVHGYGWSQTEVAEVLEISVSSVRTHLARGLGHLRTTMEVDARVD